MMNRRNFLRGMLGASVALPFLESAGATFSTGAQVPKRMVCVGYKFGFVPELLKPQKAGLDYETTPLLAPLEPHRGDFTIFSGLDHNLTGGHFADHTFLSGIKSRDSAAMPEGCISLDQKAAQNVGTKTRYQSLQLSQDKGSHISWSKDGTALPTIGSVVDLYNLLFLPLQKASLNKREKVISSNISVLDLVRTDAQKVMKDVSKRDQEKLDQYFTSIRELEKKLTQSKDWLYKPKPKVDYTIDPHADKVDFIERVPLFYDLMVLALQTDSTRVISFAVNNIGKNSGGFEFKKGYHDLTHHGKLESKLELLEIIESYHTSQASRFLDKLKEVKEPNGKSLLENTITLFGSGMGNAASHSNRDLPLILAGGGFNHQGHAVYERKPSRESIQANNLYLTMLNKFGVETDRFNTSTGTLTGFDA